MATTRERLRGGAWGRRTASCLALCLAGCGGEPEGYDAGVRYPARGDGLVVRLPASAPSGLPPAGRPDEAIALAAAAGGRVLHPDRLPDAKRAELSAVVDDLFGTPAAPRVPDGPAVPDLDMSPGTLAAGSRVYRRQCVQCHGLAGDGRGPTGAWVYPYPRDFRQGVYKVSTVGVKPSAEAVIALLRRGLPGTAMPRFDLLPDAELRAVTAYVVHLSTRGETEFRLLTKLLDEDDGDPATDVVAEAAGVAGQVRAAWAAVPPDLPGVTDPADDNPADATYQASVRRGAALFGGAGGCISCHVDYGRQEVFRYDVWGLPARVPDLTRGEYRWGGSAAELARRVRNGIPASGMPGNPTLTDAEVADVVAFVRALPSPPRLPGGVRKQVYPQASDLAGR